MGTLDPGGAPDEPVRPDVRVGNADREAAITALGTHLEAGRLDIDEYGDRSARASGAVYRGELAELFIDLPAPHPTLPRAVHEEPVREEPVYGPPGHELTHQGASLPAPRHPAAAPRRPGMPVFGFALLLMMLLPMVVLAVGTGAGGGGLIVLPLLFLLIGGLRHGLGPRYRGPGPHGPWDPGPGPHGRR